MEKTLLEAWHARFPHMVRPPLLYDYDQWLMRTKRKTCFVGEHIEKAGQQIKSGRRVGYVAGPLTGIPEAFKERYKRAAEICESYGFFGYIPNIHGTDPVNHPAVTVEEVRDVDYLWAVVMADFHINFLHPVGHGNAIEAAWAETYHIPTIFCAQSDQLVSRLTRGLLNVTHILRYEHIDDLWALLAMAVAEYCVAQR